MLLIYQLNIGGYKLPPPIYGEYVTLDLMPNILLIDVQNQKNSIDKPTLNYITLDS